MQPNSANSAAYTRQTTDGFYPIQFHTRNNDPYNLLPPPPIPYAGLFRYESRSLDHSNELQKMTTQEIMDAKARAASKSHSEAERRRRERINNHFANLRSLLPNTTKTDKASLLGEVIQHLKELKRQTSQIVETSENVPTETDELSVDNASHEDGRLLIKASICCKDRSDLLPDVINTLKALRLRALRAEIITLGGRIKNVLFVTDENELSCGNTDEVVQQQHQEDCISSIEEAFKRIVEKSNEDECDLGNAKRQRTS